jgi:methylated-DNA-[protein]-cysteine S-methyltransferase
MTDTSLTEQLRRLRSEGAPPSLAAAVLEKVGVFDRYVAAESPAGEVLVAFNRRGVSAIAFADDPDLFEALFLHRFGRPARAGRLRDAPAAVSSALPRRLATGTGAVPPIDLRGLTDFERAVLDTTATIPKGEIRSYTWVASLIGRPRAVRAVGSALGHNPVPLLIPCHRVVRQDGHIGHYGLGGSPVKRAILAAEGVAVGDDARWRALIRSAGS